MSVESEEMGQCSKVDESVLRSHNVPAFYSVLMHLAVLAVVRVSVERNTLLGRKLFGSVDFMGKTFGLACAFSLPLD